MKNNLIILAVSSILALAAGFVPNLEMSEYLYQNLTWFFMLAIFVLAGAASIKVVRGFDLVATFARHWPAALLALVIVTAAALLSPPDFRILADETNLLGVSLEMHETLKTRLPLESLYYYFGQRQGISYKTEMRPAGFPFALALLHGLIGYRAANPFILNLFLAWLALLLMYLLTMRRADRAYGLVAMLLLAAFPAFVQSACSAGFEIYNLVLALALLLLFDLLLAGRAGAEPVVACLLLLAFSRYESVLGIVCFLPLLIYHEGNPEAKADNRLIWAFPLLLIPALWLRRITFNPTSFQVSDIGQAFSLANFNDNFLGWLTYFTSFEYSRLIGPFMLAMLPVGLLIWFLNTTAAGQTFKQRFFACSVGLFFFVHLLARLFYTQGNPVNPYTLRLVVIMLPAMVWLALAVIRRAEKFWALAGRQSALYAGCLAALLLMLSWPAASGSNITSMLALYREFRWVRQELSRIDAGEDTILICERPTMYVPLLQSAVGPKYAVENAGKIMGMLDIAAYSRLIFIESINYRSGKSNMPPIPAEFSTLKSEVIFETQMTGAEKLKITLLHR